ncbi:MAG TPA: putative metal-dependent hydrolase, partial [Saprospiraceae bacterium]|nr:putative metal-dependent hydrolase [Saprospiraceae bacterium]
MKKTEVTDRRYPIGRFEYGKQYSIDDTRKHIHYLAEFPNDLKKTVKKLGKGELDMTYRKGGWTARQVVHHLADSHLNAYVRTKLAITEQTPIIKPYEQGLWAETEDAKGASVKPSPRLIASLHRRWVEFLSSLSEDDLERGYFHPETGRVVSIQECIALYAWHSRHHLAHIKLVAKGEDKSDAPSHTDGEMRAERGTVVTSRSNIKKSAPAPEEAPAPEKKRRGRPPGQKSAKAAESAASRSEKPPIDRRAIMEKARAARMANIAAAKAGSSPAAAKPAAADKAAAKAEKAAARQAKAAAK